MLSAAMCRVTSAMSSPEGFVGELKLRLLVTLLAKGHAFDTTNSSLRCIPANAFASNSSLLYMEAVSTKRTPCRRDSASPSPALPAVPTPRRGMRTPPARMTVPGASSSAIVAVCTIEAESVHRRLRVPPATCKIYVKSRKKHPGCMPAVECVRSHTFSAIPPTPHLHVPT